MKERILNLLNIKDLGDLQKELAYIEQNSEDTPEINDLVRELMSKHPSINFMPKGT